MNLKKVLILSVTGLILWSAWGSKVNAEEDINFAYLNESPARITVEDWSTLEELQHRLTSVPKESLFINVEAEGLNMRETARRVKLCWDVNHSRNHYSVSISDAVEQTQDSDMLLPFLDLFGEEAGALMKQTAADEDSYISFIRLERVGGLDICTFAIHASREEQYHLIITGEWEDTEVAFQHLVISTTWYTSYSYWTWYGSYIILQVDLNFDGNEDLLIQEGSSWGSGGAWKNYRAIVWEEEEEAFAWYSSFPEQISYLDFDNKRVIDHYQLGAGYEVVCEYGVVGGEYVKTRELIVEDHMATNSVTLSYYEMGALVKQYDVTEMTIGEIAALYPDLDYWWRG